MSDFEPLADTHGSQVHQQTADGRWEPAVPLPFVYGWSWRWSIKGCQCGRKFLTLRRYERHYRRTHLRGAHHA